LKARHLYLVRVHRLENKVDVTLAWKILITTPIYNSLWNEFSDYCDRTNQDLINKITELNTIKLSFDIKEIDSSNTSI
jgi:hypothetical protein